MKIKEIFFPFKNLDINYYRVIHSIKTTIACLIGLAIERYYDWPMGQWVPITIMVVMSAQTHFGGALSKAYMRFLGTALGVVIVVTVLWFFGDNTIAVFCTIFLTSMIFTYIASSHTDISYAGTLGGVTVILILSGHNVGIETAIQRGLYIVIGIVIALIVSRFVFPIHARDRFRYHVAKTLRYLSKLYLLTTREKINAATEEINTRLSSKVALDIAEQPRLIYEAGVGSMAFTAKKDIFVEILNSEKFLSHLISLMYHSLGESRLLADTKKRLPIVEELHITIAHSLNDLADCFESIKIPQIAVVLNESLVKVSQLIEKKPENGVAKQLMVEHSFLFFMEQILRELENLSQLIAKVNGKTGESVI